MTESQDVFYLWPMSVHRKTDASNCRLGQMSGVVILIKVDWTSIFQLFRTWPGLNVCTEYTV